MQNNRALLGTLATLTLWSIACGNEVGECKGTDEGRDTVLVGGSVQYGGQAIMNLACAGCHGSNLKGSARKGAPAGLDFDLPPANQKAIEEASAEGVTLTDEHVSALRTKQRRIYQDREWIYQQVRDGLMPPDDMYESFRLAVASIMNSDEDSPCTKGKALAPITSSSSQEVLRNWLACKAPIVEVSSPELMAKSQGQAGDQFPSCEAQEEPTEDGGMPPVAITLGRVQEEIFDVSCKMCHNAKGLEPKLDDAETSYKSLVDGVPGSTCMGKPYVTAGDPAKSFLHEIISSESPSCGKTPMPPTGALQDNQIKLVADWIRAGAKP